MKTLEGSSLACNGLYSTDDAHKQETKTQDVIAPICQWVLLKVVICVHEQVKLFLFSLAYSLLRKCFIQHAWLCFVEYTIDTIFCFLQISYASRSLALSNREKFPTLFRALPSESARNFARVAWIEHFGWEHIATMYEKTALNLVSLQDK